MRATRPIDLILLDTNANARYDAPQHVITSGIPTLQTNLITYLLHGAESFLRS